jgi:hypothetical protein
MGVIFITGPIWTMGEPCQLRYRVFSLAFHSLYNDCGQWVIKLQEGLGWPGSGAKTKALWALPRVQSILAGPLMTQIPQLEVSRATHTAQLGQIHFPLSAPSAVST